MQSITLKSPWWLYVKTFNIDLYIHSALIISKLHFHIILKSTCVHTFLKDIGKIDPSQWRHICKITFSLNAKQMSFKRFGVENATVIRRIHCPKIGLIYKHQTTQCKVLTETKKHRVLSKTQIKTYAFHSSH